MREFVIVITTVDDENIAENLANKVIEKKLAACVQIIPIKSVYRWKGNVERAKEYLCIIKTRKDLYDLLEKEIKESHPYEVPEIIAVPISSGLREYLAWIEDSTIDIGDENSTGEA